jgi:hypothetical protein
VLGLSLAQTVIPVKLYSTPKFHRYSKTGGPVLHSAKLVFVKLSIFKRYFQHRACLCALLRCCKSSRLPPPFAMSALSIRRVAVLGCRTTRSTRFQVRANTSVPFNRDKTSNTPLVEHYRSAWPDGNPDKPADSIVLPERTVSDDVLNFGMRMSMEQGQSFFYPHLETNPADLKVRMMVRSEILTLVGSKTVIEFFDCSV